MNEEVPLDQHEEEDSSPPSFAVRRPIAPEYLGDGVYGSHDGFQIWLHLNSHDSPALIALDSRTMESLIHYARKAGVIGS